MDNGQQGNIEHNITANVIKVLWGGNEQKYLSASIAMANERAAKYCNIIIKKNVMHREWK
jgi:hypothetical protein